MKKLIFVTLLLALGCGDTKDSGNGNNVDEQPQGRDPDTTECFSNLTGLNTREKGYNQVVFFNTTDTILKLDAGDREVRLEPFVPSEQIFVNGLHLGDIESGDLKGAIDWDVNAEFGQTIWLTQGEDNCIDAARAVKREDTKAIAVANLAYPNIEVSDSDDWQVVAEGETSEPFDESSEEFYLRLPNGETHLTFTQQVVKPTVAYALFGESIGYYLMTEDGQILRADRTFRLRSLVVGAESDFSVCSEDCAQVASDWGEVSTFDLTLSPVLEIGLVAPDGTVVEPLLDRSSHVSGHFETELDIYVFSTNDGPSFVTVPTLEPTAEEVSIINLTRDPVTVTRLSGDEPEVFDLAPGERVMLDPADSFSVGDYTYDTDPNEPQSLAVFRTPVDGATVIGFLNDDHIVWNGARAIGEVCNVLDPCNAEGQCYMGTCRPIE